MVLMMIINLLSGINPSAVRAADEDHFRGNNLSMTATGGINLTEKASGYSEGSFDVEMSVEGNDEPTTETKKLDVVLAIDTSNSMGEPGWWEKHFWSKDKYIYSYERLNNAKAAAKKFVAGLLKGTKNNVRIAVVGFGSEAYTAIDLSYNKNSINDAIDNLDLTGATYTQDALKRANAILAGSQADQKRIVLISDGVPTYGFDGKKKIGTGNDKLNDKKNLSDKIYNLLYKEADKIKQNAIITSIGIGVYGKGEEVLKRVAESSGGYHKANEFASNLESILKDLEKQIKNEKVNNGKFVIPMADYVQFKDDLTYKVVNNGSVVQKLTDAIKIEKPSANNNILTFSNLTLGKGDKLVVKYRAELLETRKDGNWYGITNNSPVLSPLASTSAKVNFDEVINVKDTKTVNIVVNKRWIGDKVPDGVNEVKFNITPEAPAMNNTITVKENENWSGTLNALPKYKDGKEIEYKITEVTGNNYEIVGNIEKSTADNGDLVFTAKNKNTEKIKFTVKKEWGTTPTDLQFPARVHLYANDEKVKLEAFSNNEVTFTDLDKYDASGNEIKYTVKEVNEDGNEESGEKLTNKGFEYSVKHDDSKYSSTITNTCTNPYEQKFVANLTKTWDGGISTKDVTFTFTNKADNTKTYTLTLTAANFVGNTEWRDTIELPKYNTDSSPATYFVTEGEVKGFKSDKTSVDDVSADTPNVSFTNTRNTKSITVTKTWKGTPAEYKINTVEVILSGKVNGTEVYSEKQNIKLGTDATTFNNVPLTDENGADIEYSVKENGQDGDSVTLDGKHYIVSVESDDNGGYIINNRYASLATDTIDVTLTKKWKDGVGNKAVFTFTQEGSPNFSRTVELPKDVKDSNLQGNVEGDKWTVTVKLNKFNNNDEASIARYKVTEAADTAFTQTSDLGANDYIGEGGKKEVTFTNTRVMKELTLNKKWAGPADEKAVFKIIPSNKTVTLNNNSWTEKLALPVYDLDGKVIEYTVTEEDVPGYKAKEKEQKFSFVDPASHLVDKELTFTNVKYTDTENSTFTIHKTWKSDFKQNVAFGLFDDLGNKIGHIITLTKDNALLGSDVIWSRYFITDPLPEYRENGDKITYEIKEMDGLDDNAKPIENNKITIGNRTYTVERRIDGNIYNFTNTDITTGDVKATKIWEGTPSTEAKFGLFKKGTNNKIDVAPEVETKDNGREVVMTFKNLPFADADGKAVEYEVREMNATGDILNNGDVLAIGNKEYKVSYKEGNDGVIITNTELIKITVNKIWGDNVPGIAKKAIKFRVLGGYLTGGTLSAENNWTWTSGYLPLYDHDNNKINYSVVETEINGEKIDLNQGFATDTDGNTVYYHKAFKITLEGAKDITESKTVNITNSIREAEQPQDSNNRIIHIVKDWTVNAKKKNVKVKLYKLDTAKGEIVAVEGKEVELTEANKWMAELEVPKADNGEEIVYYAFETAIGDDSIDESKLSPNLYNDGYRIGEYNVNITELTSDTQNAKFGDYGFYILNESDNNPVQPEEKVTINVTKQWAIPTTSEYVKPVKVRLFVENGGNLVPVFGVNDLTLNADNGWKGKFENLDKTDYDGNEINYHVAEVGIEGEQDKEIMSLSDMLNVNGYTIGKYHVDIDGDGSENIVITNDVKLIDVTAVKHWLGIVPRYAVQFTLYSSHDNTFDSTGKVATLDGTDNDLVATFKDLPALDSNGKPIVYYVFETKIGDAVPTFNALAEATTNYPVNVTGGRYNVVITDNGTVGEKVVIIQNSYVANSGDPVVPIIPGLDPGTTPGTTPGTIPGTTPALDVPDDATPQGDANIKTPDDTNEDEDGFVEVDEDETPQGKANVKDNTNANDAKRKETTDIEDDSTPQGNTALPKTGGTARDFLGIIGMGLIGLGLVFKKRKH